MSISLTEGVVDTEEGVNVIVPDKVYLGTKLPDGACVEYIQPERAICLGERLDTGECVKYEELEIIELEPEIICKGEWAEGKCVKYEDGEVIELEPEIICPGV